MSERVATDEPQAMDIMVRSFVSAAPEDTLGELAERLAAADAGSALVVEYGRLIGIITSRDIVRAVGGRVHPSEARVRHWMTGDPVVARPELPAVEAARRMVGGGFHHLPVVVDERPVGVVGLRTVVGLLRQAGLGW
ncbi:MAG TPA: CBS domain-containing protein [Gaiellaceae bacterium]|jgi:CBS domain-containing protein